MNENAASYSEEIRALKDKLEKLEQENDSLKKSAQEEANAMNDSTKSEKLRLGETWKVPGLFTLTINSVTSTTKRNEYAEKKPAQVVIINYTYENLGFQGGSQDLYITPERVVDAENPWASPIPSRKVPPPSPHPSAPRWKTPPPPTVCSTPARKWTFTFPSTNPTAISTSQSFARRLRKQSDNKGGGPTGRPPLLH